MQATFVVLHFPKENTYIHLCKCASVSQQVYIQLQTLGKMFLKELGLGDR